MKLKLVELNLSIKFKKLYKEKILMKLNLVTKQQKHIMKKKQQLKEKHIKNC